jgi:S-adenosylmethionine decarboxylase
MFGVHLMLECYECNKERLNDESFVAEFLDELCEVIGMRKISKPNVIRFPGNPETFDKGGLCGVIFIAESHISIHTFPDNNGFASVDVFSCKEFDVNKAIEFIVNKLEPKKYEKNVIMRGKDFEK